MRDWLMILAPLVAVMYFATHPAELNVLVAWLNGFTEEVWSSI